MIEACSHYEGALSSKLALPPFFGLPAGPVTVSSLIVSILMTDDFRSAIRLRISSAETSIRRVS